MNTSLLLGWGLAWTLLGGAGLLLTACLIRGVRRAAVRRLALIGAFACIAVLPVWHGIGSVLGRSSGNAPFPHGAGAETGRPWSIVNGTSPGEEASCAPALAPPPNRPITSILLGGWLAGAIWTLGRVGLAWRQVNRWRADSEVCDARAAVPGFPSDVQARIALGRHPAVPVVWGLRKPVVLLPRAARHWERARLAAALWHELGHIRRGDHLMRAGVLALCALHWFNPVFWFAARQLEAESELAADDFAILRGVRPSAYAAELLAIARELRAGPWRCPAEPAAMAKTRSLEHRVRAIIDPHSRRGSTARIAWAQVSIGSAALSLALIAAAPRMAAWFDPQEDPPASTCLAAGNQPLSDPSL